MFVTGIENNFEKFMNHSIRRNTEDPYIQKELGILISKKIIKKIRRDALRRISASRASFLQGLGAVL